LKQLYRELDAKGLTKFRRSVTCPMSGDVLRGEPIIGIPFYLAHAALAQLEKETHDLEDAREIMMYLRHEAGHAFTYAYSCTILGVEKDLRAVPAALSRQLPAGAVFRVTMCGTCRDGMRRSIRMKILPRRLRCG